MPRCRFAQPRASAQAHAPPLPRPARASAATLTARAARQVAERTAQKIFPQPLNPEECGELVGPLSEKRHAAPLPPYQPDAPRPSPHPHRTRRIPPPIPSGHIAGIQEVLERSPHTHTHAHTYARTLACTHTRTLTRPAAGPRTRQVKLLEKPPAGDEAFLMDLLENRVPPGVDEAAYVKAGFLTAVVEGQTTSPLVSKVKAVELLGTMQASARPGPATPPLRGPVAAATHPHARRCPVSLVS